MNNDLISRNALIQHAYSAVVDGVEKDIIDLSDVDNAPTVDIKDQIAGAYNEGYMCGNKEEEKARPQGEWITENLEKPYGRCNRCGEICEVDNYCGNCGAKMKGD